MAIEVVAADRMGEVFEDLDRLRDERKQLKEDLDRAHEQLSDQVERNAELQAQVNRWQYLADMHAAAADSLDAELDAERKRLMQLRRGVRMALQKHPVQRFAGGLLADIHAALTLSHMVNGRQEWDGK